MAHRPRPYRPGRHAPPSANPSGPPRPVSITATAPTGAVIYLESGFPHPRAKMLYSCISCKPPAPTGWLSRVYRRQVSSQHDVMEESSSDAAAKFQRHWWGYGVGLVVAYAFGAPVLRFVPPAPLFVFGFLACTTVAVSYFNSLYRDLIGVRFGMVVNLMLIGLTGVTGCFFVVQAAKDAVTNDARCLAIQRDMLAAHPRRSDGPDLFQALGCRPQGQGGVAAPPTDRERKAGRPLPWGGYPPPVR